MPVSYLDSLGEQRPRQGRTQGSLFGELTARDREGTVKQGRTEGRSSSCPGFVIKPVTSVASRGVIWPGALRRQWTLRAGFRVRRRGTYSLALVSHWSRVSLWDADSLTFSLLQRHQEQPSHPTSAAEKHWDDMQGYDIVEAGG